MLVKTRSLTVGLVTLLGAALFPIILRSGSLNHESIPHILSTSPVSNELNVKVGANITVVFDAEMDVSTINNSTFTVNARSTGLHLGTISYDSVSRTATFDPIEDFDVGETVTAVLTTGLESSDGFPLNKSYVWTFTTGVKNTGLGTFGPAVTYPIDGHGWSICAADLDGDGDMDLATADYDVDKVSVLLNNGDGTFAASSAYRDRDCPKSIIAADLNGDGRLDLATANWVGDHVVVHWNTSDGILGPVNYRVGSGPTSVIAGDFDGDGDLDLAASCYYDRSVSVCLNYGGGNIGPYTDYSAGNYSHSVFAADLDDDGDLDFAVANYGDDNIMILSNNGDATFVGGSTYSVGAGPRSVSAADLDGDGDLDLATANKNYDNISVLLNNGDGTFGSRTDYPAGGWPSAVFAADLDGDGDIDLATANETTTNVSVLLNNGDGTFVFNSHFTVGNGPMSVVAADLDGDGDLDLATANRIFDDVSVLLYQYCVDSDGDGYGDPGAHDECPDDNCPAVYNPYQEDIDADGIGDLCDDCVDTDNDGFGDPEYISNTCPDDNCPSAYNPEQEDDDGDGVGNACDACDCTNQGDCNDDGAINPLDVVFLIGYALRGEASPPSEAMCSVGSRGDFNCDDHVNLVDVVSWVNYVYRQPAAGPCNPCARRVNLASGILPSVSSTRSGCRAEVITDGRVDPSGILFTSWSSAIGTDAPQWIELEFGAVRRIDRVIIYWVEYFGYSDWSTSQEYHIQMWRGFKYVNVAIINPTPMERTVTKFPEFTTSKLRIYQPTGKGSQYLPSIMWLTELVIRGY